MRPEWCSIHTHNTFCDGKNSLEEMAAAAYAAGVHYFGISCHSHTPISLDVGAVLSADMSSYRNSVLQLREAYRGRMEVLLGIEWDSCSDIQPEGFDYWIGSVHYQHGANEKYYAADWGEEQFTACRDELFQGDSLAVAEGYFSQVKRVAAMKPPILGHFDLITKLNAGNRFFDENDPRYRHAALDALQTVDPLATVLEINTGGVSRGYRAAPYPALFLLKEWNQMGGQVILTSDSHSTETILYGYDQAAELAKAAGFNHCVLLTRNGFVACPL